MSAAHGALGRDLDEAVRRAGGPKNQGLDESGAWTTVLPVAGGTLVPATARLSTSGTSFTLSAPLAALDGPPDAEVLAALLGRHADADRSAGAAYALVDVDAGAVVTAISHWVLASITSEQFAELLKAFAQAVRALHADLADMAAAGAPLVMLDEAWRGRPS